MHAISTTCNLWNHNLLILKGLGMPQNKVAKNRERSGRMDTMYTPAEAMAQLRPLLTGYPQSECTLWYLEEYHERLCWRVWQTHAALRANGLITLSALWEELFLEMIENGEDGSTIVPLSEDPLAQHTPQAPRQDARGERSRDVD